jgi:putative membrane protein
MPDDENRRRPIDLAQQYLANERTFLSWLRTSIALIGLGFVVARFGLFLREFQLVVIQRGVEAAASSSNNVIQQLPEHSFSSILGVLMIALGVALIFYSLKSYRDGNKEIESGVYVPKKSVVYTGAILLAIFGGATILYLLTVSLMM